jgi:ribosomal protein S18 acetylase RimI-like enzyme
VGRNLDRIAVNHKEADQLDLNSIEKHFDKFNSNYYASCQILCSHAEKGSIWEDEETILTYCGLAIPFLNNVFVKYPEHFDYQNWAQVEQYFVQRKPSYQLVVPNNRPQPRHDLLAKYRLECIEKLPAMVLDGRDTALSPPRIYEQLEIRQVSGESELNDFRTVAGPAFSMPDFVADRILSRNFAADERQNLYVAYLNSRAVSTSMLFVSHGVAGIYWVATTADVRGQGLGEAMTYHASSEGLKSVNRYCVLQASESGAPIYARMGYKMVYQYQKYLYSKKEN